jgi:enoyl-CoA hydratase/carnithine racemase
MSPFSTLLYAAEQNIALDLAEADDNVKAIVISGAGKAFSSGCDLKDHERADQCTAADRA